MLMKPLEITEMDVQRARRIERSWAPKDLSERQVDYVVRAIAQGIAQGRRQGLELAKGSEWLSTPDALGNPNQIAKLIIDIAPGKGPKSAAIRINANAASVPIYARRRYCVSVARVASRSRKQKDSDQQTSCKRPEA
jgi:hypothetical protein